MNAAGGVRWMRGDKVEVVLYIRIRGIAHVEEGREVGAGGEAEKKKSLRMVFVNLFTPAGAGCFHERTFF